MTEQPEAMTIHPKYIEELRREKEQFEDYVPICPHCGEETVVLISCVATCEIPVHRDGWSFDDGWLMGTEEEAFKCTACGKFVMAEFVFGDPPGLAEEEPDGKDAS